MMIASAACLKQIALIPQKRFRGPLTAFKHLLQRCQYTYLAGGLLKRIPIMSPLTSIGVMVPMEVGEWITARNPKERADLLPVFAGVNLAFFGLTPLLNKLLNHGCSSIQARLQGMPNAKILQAGQHAARVFVLNYGLTWAGIAGFILIANRFRQNTLEPLTPPPKPLVKPLLANIAFPNTPSMSVPAASGLTLSGSGSGVNRPLMPPYLASQMPFMKMPYPAFSPFLVPTLIKEFPFGVATHALSITPAQRFSGKPPHGMV
jgi:hypothetical protein